MEGGVLGFTSFTTLWPQNVQLFLQITNGLKLWPAREKEFQAAIFISSAITGKLGCLL